MVIIKAAKIETPPKVGTLEECELLSSGSSKRFFIFATLIIAGIAKYVMRKDVKNKKTNLISKIFRINE
jgi:hypothetical protein